MRLKESFRGSFVAVVVVTAGLLVRPAAGQAQTVVGEAKGVQATTFGLLGGLLGGTTTTTTVLAGTGTLAGAGDARDASLVTGSIPALVSGEVIDAVTMGWSDQVTSVASLANLGMTVGGTGISADFVMSRATALLGTAGSGSSIISGLQINGVPVAVTGAPNQAVAIPGGQVVINEVTASPAGTTANALHATVVGVADVVVASATAGIQ